MCLSLAVRACEHVGMISPLTKGPMRIRGIGWLQGENDQGDDE
eukprot:COSAG03_NODE_929_length_5276_cov_15.813599_4_plen_43_part_00